jgi:hypothetical protein
LWSCVTQIICTQDVQPRRITAEEEEQIIAVLEAMPHASRVAWKLGVSFSTVWRRAVVVGIELTAGREAKDISGLRLNGARK